MCNYTTNELYLMRTSIRALLNEWPVTDWGEHAKIYAFLRLRQSIALPLQSERKRRAKRRPPTCLTKYLKWCGWNVFAWVEKCSHASGTIFYEWIPISISNPGQPSPIVHTFVPRRRYWWRGGRRSWGGNLSGTRHRISENKWPKTRPDRRL